MSLIEKVCRQCGEMHLAYANGNMSIHTTERGERCSPDIHPRRQARTEPAPLENHVIVKSVVNGGSPGLKSQK